MQDSVWILEAPNVKSPSMTAALDLFIKEENNKENKWNVEQQTVNNEQAYLSVALFTVWYLPL